MEQTSNFVLETVELDSNWIGTVQEGDDVVDFGASSGYSSGDGGSGVELFASLERSGGGEDRRRWMPGKLGFSVTNVGAVGH